MGGVDCVVRDLYTCPNVQDRAAPTSTSTPGQARPFRAPGHPQGAWALEQMIDELAEKIGMDPVELRAEERPDRSARRAEQPALHDHRARRRASRRARRQFGWAEARKRARAERRHPPRRRRGGRACGRAAAGGPPATIIVKVFADGSVNLNMGATDIGTGTKTVMAMVVVEELGVPLDRIQVEWADTGTTQYATPSGGSKTVPTESPAVRAAALDVKQQLLAAGRRAAEAARRRTWRCATARSSPIADPSKKVALPAHRRRCGGAASSSASATAGRTRPAWSSTRSRAHFAEVEVNTRTGEVKVLRFLAAQDSGRPS